MFWKRNSAVAVATLTAAWVTNSAWSFTGLPQLLDMPSDANAYVTLIVTLTIGIVGNLLTTGRDGYFRTKEYQSRLETATNS